MSMNKESFYSWAVKELEKCLPGSRESSVELKEFDLLNRSYTGAILNIPGPELQVSPIVNLDRLYMAYDHGMPLGEIRNMMLSDLMYPGVRDLLPEGITSDYSAAKDRLFVRLCSYGANKEALSEAPYVKIEDMAMTFHILLKNDGGIASVLVTDPLLEEYGISKETLAKDALKNNGKVLETAYMPLMDVALGRLNYRPISDLPKRGRAPMIITNKDGVYGASALFCPGIMQKMSEYYGGDFIALPSSVHEMILLPGSEADYKGLRDIVTAINMNDVADDDRLTDNVYHYDAKERLFEAMDTYQMRRMGATVTEGYRVAEDPKADEPRHEAEHKHSGTER